MDQCLTFLHFTFFTNFYAKNMTQNFYFFYPFYIVRFLPIPYDCK